MAEYDLVVRGGKIVDGTGDAPFVGDVAIKDGLIAAVGKVSGAGAEEVDATGMIVTPGFVDIHTHYDAQATWDNYLTPSTLHGVTTIVMGNCGVGFAPVRPDQHSELIELMEAVEDIPGAAMHEGINWEWETFPEFMDALERKKHACDIGVQVPHCAVRVYVMGQRGIDNEDATEKDIAEMKAIAKDGMAAGALGFSTTRTDLHNTLAGDPVPGTHAALEELFGIAEGLQEHGGGIFQIAATHRDMDKEFNWMKDIAQKYGLLVTFPLQQIDERPELVKIMLDKLEEAAKEGITNIRGQHSGRPVGVLMGWQTSVHPFIAKPAYNEIAGLPIAERIEKLRDPAVRKAIIEGVAPQLGVFGEFVTKSFHKMYPMHEDENYEPAPEASATGLAEKSDQTQEEIAYDAMMAQNGEGLLYFPLFGYSTNDLSQIEELLLHPNVGLSLADGGAHVGAICDGSTPTFMLTHWVRDRSRGPKIPLETIVKIQTSDTAAQYGLNDRGAIRVGLKGDLNVIDLDNLRLPPPKMVFDLPAGGRRLFQGAEGYKATIVSGKITHKDGVPTGALPGKLIRGPQSAA